MIQCRQELHSHVFRFHRLHQRRADSDSQGIANPMFWLLSKIIYLFGGIAVHNSCFGGIGSPLALVCMHDKNAPFSLSCIEEGTAISRAFLRINGRELSPLSILYAVFELFAQAPKTIRMDFTQQSQASNLEYQRQAIRRRASRSAAFPTAFPI